MYAVALLELEALRRRDLLARLFFGELRSTEAHLAAGSLLLAGQPVRVDAVELALGALRAQPPPFPMPPLVLASIGDDAKILGALGYAVLDDGTVTPKRKRRRRGVGG